jgi:hypothetical protein
MMTIVKWLSLPVVIVLLLPQSSTESQTASARLGADIHVKEEVQFVLGAVLRQAALSGGVAEDIGCSTFPTAQLDVQQGATVQEAMGAFVAQNSAYRWSEDANVVNLMPVVEFPLLNAKIRTFELETTDTTAAEAVLYDLLNLPEIRQRATELNLKPGMRQGGLAHLNPGSDQRTPTPIRLSLHDVSLQEAFNSVVRIYGHTIWMYDERHCNGERTYVVRASKEY